MKALIERRRRHATGHSLRLLGVATAVCIACLAWARPSAAAERSPVDTAVASVIARADWIVHFRPIDHGDRLALARLYTGTSGALLWVAQGKPTAAALAVLARLRAADDFGLIPRDYAGETIAALALPGGGAPTESNLRRAQFDVSLSAAALLLITDLHYGRVDARAAGFELDERRDALDLVALVRALAQGSDAQRLLSGIEPQFYHYKLLESALARYRELARAAPRLTRLAPLGRRSVRPGERYAGAPQLRELLTALGDLPARAHAPVTDKAAAQVLDPELLAGLRRFQLRHGLAADGVLGTATMRELTTPFAWRVRQIELTLERWRWLPVFKTPPIIVNIPQFRLFAFRSTADRAADILQMDVIVGRTYPRNRTPVFVADMRYVIFRPYWDVPRSITMREMLPAIESKPGFMEHEHLEIVRGETDAARALAVTPETLRELAAGAVRLRQRPGPDNALGLIKFVLPNAHDVYLHSTPAQRLFGEARRAFSHGCIRVSDPVALAAYVLRDTPGEWTADSIQAAMNGSETRRVRLAHPIKVMILYGTVLATEAGQVMFFEDLYGQDRALERLLGLSAVPRPAAP